MINGWKEWKGLKAPEIMSSPFVKTEIFVNIQISTSNFGEDGL